MVGSWLRAWPALAALGVRVAGQVPSSFDSPWIHVLQLDDQAVGDSRSDHLISFLLQIDCYAGNLKEGQQTQALNISSEVREALKAMAENGGAHDGGVVSGVRFVSNPRIPDDSMEPARERYSRTVEVWMHG